MSRARKLERCDIPPPPPLQPPPPPEESPISSHSSRKDDSPPFPSSSNFTLPSSPPCSANSADIRSSKGENGENEKGDSTLGGNGNCCAIGFNTKLRSISDDSNHTVSTSTVTAEEDNASRDSPPPSPTTQDVALSRQVKSQADPRKVEQQRELKLSNYALQTLLRDVTFAHNKDDQPLQNCLPSTHDNVGPLNAPAAIIDTSLDFSFAEARSSVSSPGKVSLRERLHRRILKTSKKQQTAQSFSPCAGELSSDGESLSSVRRRRRLFKKCSSNSSTGDNEELNEPIQKQEPNDDYNNTSDILSGYTSLTDDYMISDSDNDKESTFFANADDADGDSIDKEVQINGGMQRRKKNIKRHRNQQCRKSRNKAALDALLRTTSESDEGSCKLVGNEGSFLDRDQADAEDNNEKMRSSSKKETNVMLNDEEHCWQKLPGSTLVADKIHRKNGSKKEKTKFKESKTKASPRSVFKASAGDSHSSEALLRLSRQVRYGRRGELPAQENRVNKVKMHVYDLIASETMVPLPWGCDFPIGKCFSAVNSTLHALGTGAYHVGVEVNGIEYAFGANNIEGLSGVFTSVPQNSPGYEYRTTIDFGDRRTIRKTWISVPKAQCFDLIKSFADSSQSSQTKEKNYVDDGTPNEPLVSTPGRNMTNSTKESTSAITVTPLRANGVSAKSLSLQSRSSCPDKEKIPSVYREVETFMDGHSVMVALSREYMGTDYDLLRKNCCTFALQALIRLGVPREEIPTWFYNIAEAGAATEDTVKDVEENVLSPLRRMMSGSSVDENEDSVGEEKIQDNEYGSEQHGFEVIAKSKGGSLHRTEMEIVRVVESIVGNGKGYDGNSLSTSNRIPSSEDAAHGDESVGIRHTLSWTY